MTSNDALTTDALALVEAVAEGRNDMAARVIAQMDNAELQGIVSRLLHLVDLRVTVGADLADTAEWARWFKSRGIDLR